ncbi:MAG: glycosyltransferase family 4 protein [Actinomycetes bacterium]
MSSTAPIEPGLSLGQPESGNLLNILVLTDRDWTHPQGGGTGTHLHEQVKHWLAWGHRVTVVAGGHPGALPVERTGNLTVRRVGSRTTVFPRSIIKGRRSLEPRADVVFEVINGITFLTPIWMDIPRVGMIHHIHREHYVREMGRPGVIAAAALETIPLKLLYRDTTFMTVSDSTASEIAALGVPRSSIQIAHNGVESDLLLPGVKADKPTILYLGRLKKYKRIEMLLRAVHAIPDVELVIAGEGDHRPDLEAEIAALGIADRVHLLGFVTEEEKMTLLQQAWLNVTASSVEGWSIVVMEAAACRTPTVAMRVGGLREAVVDGTTGVLADSQEQLTSSIAEVLSDSAMRERMAQAARDRSVQFSWERTAAKTIDVLRAAVETGGTVRSAGGSAA